MHLRCLVICAWLSGACGSSTGTSVGADAGTGADGGTSEADAAADATPSSPRFTVVTFNTGTTSGLDHESDGDGYGDAQAQLSDQHYGDGLAWVPAVEAVTTWFATVAPEVVVFQEIFYSGECESIPDAAKVGFVCENWSPGDPTVAQVLLGEGYQVSCHPNKNDKCIAVKKSFGSIRQCDDPDFCLEGLDGVKVNNCGGGARIARATIDLVAGGEITVVNVHGTSGSSSDDANCRAKQVEQVFADMDGQPGANGARNVILGDFNTDPGRIPSFLDKSVERWNQYVGGNQPFQWVSPYGSSATPTYSSTLNIDYVISDAFTGNCYVPGVDGEPAVYDQVLFDHKPLVCDIGDL
jgi:hypothetical protein